MELNFTAQVDRERADDSGELHSGRGLETSTPIDSSGLHLDREPQVASDEFLEDEFGPASLGSRASGAYKQRTISVDLQWTRAETGLGKRP